MNDFDLNSIPGISFTDLLGGEDQPFSLDRVEVFLDKIMAAIADRVQINPNQLVRVVHRGKVVWMTQDQAVNFLDTGEEGDSLHHDVQSALKADLRIIRQELEILLALATYTLGKYKQLDAISPEDFARIEPSLARRQREISDGVAQTAESEAILHEKRRRNPLLDEYEDMMGRFLNAKSNGQMDEALKLARELAGKKKNYLLLTRAIEPDIRTIQYHRLNLQKTKKRILNTQGDLCSTRIDALQLELNDLKTNLTEVKSKLAEAEERGMDSANDEISKLRTYDLEGAEQEIKEKVVELHSLEKETAVIQRQERELDAVISHIAENVLGETDIKVSMDDVKHQQRMSNPKKPESSAAPDDGQSAKPRHGMHFKR
ncbi:MAG: hypothetical protein GC154_15635 [bacterium]|nr:hypothetical protein [bacterium]